MPSRVGTTCPNCRRRKPLGQRCPTCTSRRGVTTTSGRGYGRTHQTLRDAWAPVVAEGKTVCAKPGCGKIIKPGERWQLGHVPGSRVRYRGPEHAACNTDTKRGDDE